MSVDFVELQKKIDDLIKAKNKSEGAITVLEEQILGYRTEIADIQKECIEKFECTIEELAENLGADEETLVNLLDAAVEKYNAFKGLNKASNS
jgi:predicted  nucleic acid-binding Zn-ribbon protein